MDPVLLSRMRRERMRLAAIGLALGLAGSFLPAAPRAEEISPELAERLTAAQRRVYEDYRKARGAFDKRFSAYWRSVDAKRDARKARRLLGQAYTTDDYIHEHPPKYAGP